MLKWPQENEMPVKETSEECINKGGKLRQWTWRRGPWLHEKLPGRFFPLFRPQWSITPAGGPWTYKDRPSVVAWRSHVNALYAEARLLYARITLARAASESTHKHPIIFEIRNNICDVTVKTTGSMNSLALKRVN